ncbi:hypothetical protein MRY87_08340 [bacterium]|nr:hypothetical protein [bacterium]
MQDYDRRANNPLVAALEEVVTALDEIPATGEDSARAESFAEKVREVDRLLQGGPGSVLSDKQIEKIQAACVQAFVRANRALIASENVQGPSPLWTAAESVERLLQGAGEPITFSDEAMATCVEQLQSGSPGRLVDKLRLKMKSEQQRALQAAFVSAVTEQMEDPSALIDTVKRFFPFSAHPPLTNGLPVEALPAVFSASLAVANCRGEGWIAPLFETAEDFSQETLAQHPEFGIRLAVSRGDTSILEQTISSGAAHERLVEGLAQGIQAALEDEHLMKEEGLVFFNALVSAIEERWEEGVEEKFQTPGIRTGHGIISMLGRHASAEVCDRFIPVLLDSQIPTTAGDLDLCFHHSYETFQPALGKATRESPEGMLFDQERGEFIEKYFWRAIMMGLEREARLLADEVSIPEDHHQAQLLAGIVLNEPHRVKEAIESGKIAIMSEIDDRDPLKIAITVDNARYRRREPPITEVLSLLVQNGANPRRVNSRGVVIRMTADRESTRSTLR